MLEACLCRLIVDGELAPGFPIKEADIAQQLGVSKTPVREALRQLERDGFIANVPGRGSIVSHIGPRDIREMFEIREIIETGIARRAARIEEKDVLRKKRDELKRFVDSGVPGDYDPQDDSSWEDVHLCIVEALENEMLSEMYSRLLNRIRRIRNYYGRKLTQRRIQDMIADHFAILDAIVEGDERAAELAVQRHLRDASVFLMGLTVPERK